MVRKELLDEYFEAVAALPTAVGSDGSPEAVALEAAFAGLRDMAARLTEEEREAIRGIARAWVARSLRGATGGLSAT